MSVNGRKFIDPFELEVKAAAENLKALGAVNLAAIFLALTDDREKFYEKDNIKSMIYDKRPLSVFDMPVSEYGAFRRDAESYRIINSAIVDSRHPDTVNVIIKTEDMPRVKKIFDEASYDTSNIIPEDESKNPNARPPQDGSSARGGRTSKQAEGSRMRTNTVRSAVIAYRQVIERNQTKSKPEPVRQPQSWRDLLAGKI